MALLPKQLSELLLLSNNLSNPFLLEGVIPFSFEDCPFSSKYEDLINPLNKTPLEIFRAKVVRIQNKKVGQLAQND